MSSQPAISVIIPTLDEEGNMKRLLPQLQAMAPAPEIIVSDGGSTDATVAVVEQFNVKLTCRAKGRGPQLNAGATLARGEVLLFLHADSTLPSDSYNGLFEALRCEPALKGGAFRFSLQRSGGLWPRIYEFNVNMRCKLLNLPYGDQGFFIRRADWDNGMHFADIPLMEDVEWWERASSQLRMKILPFPLITSARRFRQRGYFVSAIRNLWMLTRYKCGVSPLKLMKEYSR